MDDRAYQAGLDQLRQEWGGLDVDPDRPGMLRAVNDPLTGILVGVRAPLIAEVIKRALDPVPVPVLMGQPALTADQLADALGCFWNAAIGAAHERQTGNAMDAASVMAEGLQAVAVRLRELAEPTPEDDQTCTCQAYPTHCANDCPLHGLVEPA